MVWSSERYCAWLEILVMLFQVGGLTALCVYRLAPRTQWADLGRFAIVFALVGLGIAGALCGRHDSEFALFAGGTMTFLLIGITIGNAHSETIGTTHGLGVAEPHLAN